MPFGEANSKFIIWTESLHWKIRRKFSVNIVTVLQLHKISFWSSETANDIQNLVIPVGDRFRISFLFKGKVHIFLKKIKSLIFFNFTLILTLL